MIGLRSLYLASALTLTALLSCGGGEDPILPEPPDIESLTFAPELGVDLSQMTLTNSGLYFQDIVVGGGIRVGNGDAITFNFQGWLHDGTPVDQGTYPVGMFSPGGIEGVDGLWYYLIGSGQTLSGWDLGLDQIRVGGLRRLVIPPHLAFGASGSLDGRVPGNAVLVYDLEVLTSAP